MFGSLRAVVFALLLTAVACAILFDSSVPPVFSILLHFGTESSNFFHLSERLGACLALASFVGYQCINVPFLRKALIPVSTARTSLLLSTGSAMFSIYAVVLFSNYVQQWISLSRYAAVTFTWPDSERVEHFFLPFLSPRQAVMLLCLLIGLSQGLAETLLMKLLSVPPPLIVAIRVIFLPLTVILWRLFADEILHHSIMDTLHHGVVFFAVVMVVVMFPILRYWDRPFRSAIESRWTDGSRRVRSLADECKYYLLLSWLLFFVTEALPNTINVSTHRFVRQTVFTDVVCVIFDRFAGLLSLAVVSFAVQSGRVIGRSSVEKTSSNVLLHLQRNAYAFCIFSLCMLACAELPGMKVIFTLFPWSIVLVRCILTFAATVVLLCPWPSGGVVQNPVTQYTICRLLSFVLSFVLSRLEGQFLLQPWFCVAMLITMATACADMEERPYFVVDAVRTLVGSGVAFFVNFPRDLTRPEVALYCSAFKPRHLVLFNAANRRRMFVLTFCLSILMVPMWMDFSLRGRNTTWPKFSSPSCSFFLKSNGGFDPIVAEPEAYCLAIRDILDTASWSEQWIQLLRDVSPVLRTPFSHSFIQDRCPAAAPVPFSPQPREMHGLGSWTFDDWSMVNNGKLNDSVYNLEQCTMPVVRSRVDERLVHPRALRTLRSIPGSVLVDPNRVRRAFSCIQSRHLRTAAMVASGLHTMRAVYDLPDLDAALDISLNTAASRKKNVVTYDYPTVYLVSWNGASDCIANISDRERANISIALNARETLRRAGVDNVMFSVVSPLCTSLAASYGLAAVHSGQLLDLWPHCTEYAEGSSRITLMFEILKRGIRIINTDVDVVHFRPFPASDIVGKTISMSYYYGPEFSRYDLPSELCNLRFCFGLWSWSPSAAGIRLYSQYLQHAFLYHFGKSDSNWACDDQHVFRTFLEGNMYQFSTFSDRHHAIDLRPVVTSAQADGSVAEALTGTVHILDPYQYSTASVWLRGYAPKPSRMEDRPHQLWNSGWHDRMNRDSPLGSPVSMHFTLFGPDRTWAMREELFWFVDDDWWYDAHMLYIDFDDPTLIARDLTHQQEVRIISQAMHLAHLLGRVFVLPTFDCRHSKNAGLHHPSLRRCSWSFFYSFENVVDAYPYHIRESSILYNPRFVSMHSKDQVGVSSYTLGPRDLFTLQSWDRNPAVLETIAEKFEQYQILRIGAELSEAFLSEQVVVPANEAMVKAVALSFGPPKLTGYCC